MPFHLIFVLTVTLIDAPQDRGADCSTAQVCQTLALEAVDRQDFEAFHDLAWRAIRKGRPNDPELMRMLARAQSLSGRPLDSLVMEVKGRHLLEGVPRTVIISDSEIREALAEPVRLIVLAVRDALERIPPELSADIYDRGVVLTGGGALLRNLDQRLRNETGLPVMVAENPLTSVVLGAGKMLTDLALLRKVTND